MTLVGGPEVILLDEPTTGLGPRSRRDLWQVIRELVADGVTIFLTTATRPCSPWRSSGRCAGSTAAPPNARASGCA